MSKLLLTIAILFGILILACGFVLIQSIVIWLIGEVATLILVLIFTGIFIYKVVLPELKADTEG